MLSILMTKLRKHLIDSQADLYTTHLSITHMTFKLKPDSGRESVELRHTEGVKSENRDFHQTWHENQKTLCTMQVDGTRGGPCRIFGEIGQTENRVPLLVKKKTQGNPLSGCPHKTPHYANKRWRCINKPPEPKENRKYPSQHLVPSLS